LGFADSKPKSEIRLAVAAGRIEPRPSPLASRLSEAEKEAHEAMIAKLGDKALWKN
jgi:DNA polymerase-3 subunit epsilon